MHLERNLYTIEDYRKLLAPYNLQLQERAIEAVTRRENRGNRLLNQAQPVLPTGILGLPLQPSVDLGLIPHEEPMQNPPSNELAKFMMFDSDLSSDKKDIDEAETFWALHQIFYKKFIEPKGKTRKIDSRRVRIAILDTGVAEEDPFLYTHIEQIRTARWERGRLEAEEARAAGTKLHCPPKRSFTPIKAKECFVESKNGVIDTCGHGTIAAGLFLRVAPEADIYVAKIAEDMVFKDTEAVAKAISWAASIPVDIISMSFGSRDYVPEIDVAMTQPPAGKPPVRLKFAAASNGGWNFPRGEGNMNPSAENESDRLGTLGYGIRVSWKNKPEFRQGTSYACPIAAGIAANWLEWLEYVAARQSFGVTESQKHAWGSGFGVRKILTDLMSKNTAKLRYLAPWYLCPTQMENMQDGDIISQLRTHPGL